MRAAIRLMHRVGGYHAGENLPTSMRARAHPVSRIVMPPGSTAVIPCGRGGAPSKAPFSKRFENAVGQACDGFQCHHQEDWRFRCAEGRSASRCGLNYCRFLPICGVVSSRMCGEDGNSSPRTNARRRGYRCGLLAESTLLLSYVVRVSSRIEVARNGKSLTHGYGHVAICGLLILPPAIRVSAVVHTWSQPFSQTEIDDRLLIRHERITMKVGSPEDPLSHSVMWCSKERRHARLPSRGASSIRC